MPLRRLPSRLARWTLALAALAAIAPGASRAQVPLKLAFDWSFDGVAAPFLVGLDRGYYRTEGVELTVDPGMSAIEPIARVATGGYDLGFADINALIKFRDQNGSAPVKAVFMVYDRPPYAIVARKSRGIATPGDLPGKRLGGPASSATTAQWPLFARLTGVDAAKVTLESVGIPVRTPMLAAGQVDAALGFSFRLYVDLKDRGVPLDDIVLMAMPDYGMKLYGNAIVASPKLMAERPDVLRAFLRGFLRSLRDSVRNPAGAVDIVVRREDAAKRPVELERLRMAIRDNILTADMRKHGYGAIDQARMSEAIDQIALTHQFRAKPKPEDVFDPSFLPPEPERAVR